MNGEEDGDEGEKQREVRRKRARKAQNQIIKVFFCSYFYPAQGSDSN